MGFALKPAAADPDFTAIISKAISRPLLPAPAPAAVRTRLADLVPIATTFGLVEGVDEGGVPIIVAYRSSEATGWTTVVAVALAAVDAPVTGVLWQITGPAAFLPLTSGLAALFTARRVEGPLLKFWHQVTEAKGEVIELSGHPEDPSWTPRGVASGLGSRVQVVPGLRTEAAAAQCPEVSRPSGRRMGGRRQNQGLTPSILGFFTSSDGHHLRYGGL